MNSFLLRIAALYPQASGAWATLCQEYDRAVADAARVPRGLFLGLAFALAACSTANSLNKEGELAPLPVCPLFDQDAGFMGCDANRAFVNCTASDGSGQLCLSDDPTSCPPIPVSDPACPASSGCGASIVCTDQCKANEFAVACGGIGPGGGSSVPSSCRSLSATPAGVVFACCPCGT